MNIAFCINRLALIGLGVTVTSLIRNCADTKKLKIYFLCADLKEEDTKRLTLLLADEKFKGQHFFKYFKPYVEFGKLRSLMGDWTAYGRLLLSDLVTEVETILYLDADLVVELDVLQLSDFDLGNQPLAAIYGSEIKYALEHRFLIDDCQLTAEGTYFNSGILLLNLTLWRAQELKKVCLEFANKYPYNLLTCDQTILNALFSKSILLLPDTFNVPWYASAPQPRSDEKLILHFVGSPKPWDIGGKFIHNGYTKWHSYLNKGWSNAYGKRSLKDLVRAWNIKKSYFRTVKQRITKAL